MHDLEGNQHMHGASALQRLMDALRAPLRTPHRPGGSEYRPDIDGLRAIAIISVVGFHVGLPGFGGGFVGVDVFFVISGFVITTLLLNQLRQSSSIDLLAFFARRARRLLPAFLIVTVTTIVLGSVFLTPIEGEQQGLADSAVAAALYISNLHFAWIGGDYFDPDTRLSPLLHTWSLAVEEQFYLLWPVTLLGATWAANRCERNVTRVIIVVLILVLIASLSYSCWAVEHGARMARLAFFSLPSRAWELGIGAALAIALPTLRRSGGWSGAVLTAAGGIAIGLAVITFTRNLPFPGVPALLPTLGAAAIIAGVWLSPETRTAKLLASRPLVIIGLLSYSWYLWHWPLLAIARAHALGVEDLWRDTVISVSALGLAWLTYAVVEEPVRSHKVGFTWTNLKVLRAGAAASLLVIAFAEGLDAHAARLARTDTFKQVRQAQKDKGWSREHCRNRNDKLVPRPDCMRVADPTSRILVIWGDSHADAMVGAFETANKAGRFALLPRWTSGCPPLLGVVPLNEHRPQAESDCTLFNTAVMTEIGQLQREGRLAGVVLAARWSMYLDRPSLIGSPGKALWQNERPMKGEQAATALVEGLRLTLHALVARGIKILVVAPVPEQRFEVPPCLARRSLEYCSVSRALAEENRALALRVVQQAMDGYPTFHLWDPLSALCDEDRCPAERKGIIMYCDEEHLTYSGSRELGPYLQQSAAWTAMLSETENAKAE